MYILNDYSIDNQFEDIDTLLDSLLAHTIPLFKVMDTYNLDLLKSHEIYNLKLIENLSMLGFLNLRGYPEIFKISSLLHKILHDNPYWEKNDLNHDCIKEAMKRKVGLISLEHEEYLEDKVEYKIDGIEGILPNSYNKMQLLEELWKRQAIEANEYLEQRYPGIESFCTIEGKNYFSELVKDSDIKEDEVNKIVGDLNDFMYKYLNNQDLGRLSKNIETNLHEFRTSISDSREVRILYCLNKSKIVFLNCFIKKQQRTPDSEKVFGRKLRDIVASK